jgi:hypothetical protein
MGKIKGDGQQVFGWQHSALIYAQAICEVGMSGPVYCATTMAMHAVPKL